MSRHLTHWVEHQGCRGVRVVGQWIHYTTTRAVYVQSTCSVIKKHFLNKTCVVHLKSLFPRMWTRNRSVENCPPVCENLVHLWTTTERKDSWLGIVWQVILMYETKTRRTESCDRQYILDWPWFSLCRGGQVCRHWPDLPHVLVINQLVEFWDKFGGEEGEVWQCGFLNTTRFGPDVLLSTLCCHEDGQTVYRTSGFSQKHMGNVDSTAGEGRERG